MRSRTAPAPSTSSVAPASTAAAEPFGVYVHWPFCAQKCPYCDFNSHVRFGGVDEARFLPAYLAELDHARAFSGPRVVESVFFGGGTPSLMAPATVSAILDHIARLWPVAPDAEITLEGNPGSVEAERFKGYASAGVTRVSLGVQSLDDTVLKSLGRIHSVAEAKAALAIAHSTFARVSFDLIYARPGQSLKEWRAELAEALAQARGHLSLYQLTIEPGTPFSALAAAGKLVVPEADAALALFELTQEMTSAAGLPAYEISNHAAPGEESRHNLLYWRYGSYAGCGPGAHGRLVREGVRYATSAERVPEDWAERVARDGHGWIETTALSRAEEADEMLLMGLRLAEGVELRRVCGLCDGAPPTAAGMDSTVTELSRLGLIEDVPGAAPQRRIRATPAGRFILNEIVLRLSLGLEGDRRPHAAMDIPLSAD